MKRPALDPTDRAMHAHRQPKIGQRVEVLVGSRRGHVGIVEEKLLAPTPAHDWTGLARYGVRIDGHLLDYSRVEIRIVKRGAA